MSQDKERGSLMSVITLINRLEQHLVIQRHIEDTSAARKVEVNFGGDWHLYINAD